MTQGEGVKKSQISMTSFIVGCQGVIQIGGSRTGFWQVGPIKIKASKSFLFTEDSPEIGNKDH